MATSEMPSADANSSGRSVASTAGNAGTGKPWGRIPMTSTPRAARSSTTENPIATTTATRMPGVLGDSHLRPRMRIRLSRPIPSAHGFVISRPMRNATTSPTSPSASVENPKSFGNWLIRMTTARPARYPVRTGFESRSATKPSLRAPAPTVTTPTSSASMPARAIACSGSPAASGRIVAAIIGPSDESGPRTRIGDGPTRAYAMRHTTVVYSPVMAGSPASSA